MFNGRRQPSRGRTSRMTPECQVPEPQVRPAGAEMCDDVGDDNYAGTAIALAACRAYEPFVCRSTWSKYRPTSGRLRWGGMLNNMPTDQIRERNE